APGVAHENRGAILSIEHALGGGDVIFERRERVLHYRYALTALGQLVVNPTPPGAVCEGAVYQHDVPCGSAAAGGRRRLRIGCAVECGGCDRSRHDLAG